MADAVVFCPHCQARYRVDSTKLGKTTACKKCSTRFELRQAAPTTGELASDGVPLNWEPGQVILDLYEVRPLPGTKAGYAEGGMGRVNLVWHKGWQTELAVKSLLPAKTASARDIEHFKTEAEQWIDTIGLHPHVVACHYVRVLGGLPRVFLEYIESGSLHEWVASKRLYEGGQKAALERVLDVAIQTAWGLHHVHELGLVHQDVKPHNVMMTAEGVAKVTDFGLAGARAAAFEGDQPPPVGATILATWGGMTPAYCSPEQAEIAARRKGGTPRAQLPKLTRRADIWSWAVSVLHLFLGQVTWPAGQVAHVALQREPDEPHLPPLPPAVKEVLSQCLRKRPEERPHNLIQAADALQAAYKQATGRPFPRPRPSSARALADTLNNRAVSLLDLGRPEEAEKLWKQALAAEPLHAEAAFNLGLHDWRSARIDDRELLRQMEAMRGSNPAGASLWLSRVHLERGDCAEAVRELERAKELHGSEEVKRLLDWARQYLPRSHRCLLTLEGLERREKGLPRLDQEVTLSWDGRLALARANDDTVKVWDTSSGRCVQALEGHRNVRGLSLSRDGSLALSASLDGTIKVWDVAGGRCLHALEGHTKLVQAVSLSADGRRALSGSWDTTVRVWETLTGRCLHVLEGHTMAVDAVSLSADGRRALSGSSDKTTRVWETATGRCLHVFQGHTSWVQAVVLSADGLRAITGSRDKTVRVWDTETGRCLHSFETNSFVAAISGDLRLVLCGKFEPVPTLWEACGRRLHALQGHADTVTAGSLSGDGRLALTGSEDGTVKLWDSATRLAPFVLSRLQQVEKLFQPQQAHDQALEEARRALADGRAQEAARHVRRAREQPGHERSPQALALWRQLCGCLPRRELKAAYLLHTFRDHAGAVGAVSLSGNGPLALTAGRNDTTARLWETSSGKCLHTLEHADRVCAARLSGDGRLAVSQCWAGPAAVWDTSSGQRLRSLETTESTLALSGDGRLALVGYGYALTLWDTSSGTRLHTIRGSWMSSVSLNADGRLAVTAEKKTIRLWDTSRGRCLRVLRGHEDPVLAVSLSGDGSLAISASGTQPLADGVDQTVRLWETSRGRCLRTFPRHTSAAPVLSLSGDGRHAVTGGEHDGTVKLWETFSGRCLHALEGHTRYVVGVSLSSDACLALSGSADETARLWFLDWELDEQAPSLAQRPTAEAQAASARPWWKRWFGGEK